MNKHSRESLFSEFISSLSQGSLFLLDTSLEVIFIHIELPIQKFCYRIRRISSLKRLVQNFSSDLTEILVQSYFLTLIIYFLCFLFIQIYSNSIQRYYFIDPLLSTNRQCLNIKFIENSQLSSNFLRLKENFLQENLIFKIESHKKQTFNTTEFQQLFSLLNKYHYIICQRSLYIYARFSNYINILHSNRTEYKFFLPKYARSFTIDQPPFLDLCVHTNNQTDLEQIRSDLLTLASYSYPSLNIFFFNYDFTEITITLYELDTQSTHLERVSIHTGWLYDSYSQFLSLKYYDALSTVLFDGVPRGQQTIDFFHSQNLPLPADSLLGLNEMIQQTIMVLPLCRSMNR